jgi:hypothetical protein
VTRQTPPPTSADADDDFAAFEAVIARLNATRALPARNAWEALALAERGRGARVLRKDAPAPDSDGLAFAGHAIAAPGGAGVTASNAACPRRPWWPRSAWLLHRLGVEFAGDRYCSRFYAVFLQELIRNPKNPLSA